METGNPSQPPSPPNNPDLPFFHGIEGHPVHRGSHICQIYTEPDERLDAVFEFISSGLQTGGQTYCISEQPTDEILGDYLASSGVSLPGAKQSGQFNSAINHDFYLDKGVFDSQKILGQWDMIMADAKAKKFPGVWAIADVLSELRYLQGGTQVIIYESRLEEWMRFHQATIVCQYDARVFDACMIMGLLKVHPLVLANGRVAQSPFFKAPDIKRSH